MYKREFYRIDLEVPGKSDDEAEIITYRVVVLTGGGAKSRADVFQGRFAMLPSGQWFVFRDDNVLQAPTLYTQRRVGYDQMDSKAKFDGDTTPRILSCGAFAQNVITALHLFGRLGSAEKTAMLKAAQERWLETTREREVALARETVESQVSMGLLRTSDLRSIAAGYDRRMRALEVEKAQYAKLDEESMAKDETFALRA
jgi:hypothetical protein